MGVVLGLSRSLRMRSIGRPMTCLALTVLIVGSGLSVAGAQPEPSPTAHADCGPIPGQPRQVVIGGNYFVSAKIKATCVLSADLIWLNGQLWMDGGLEASNSKQCPTTRTCTFYLRAEDPPGVQRWQSQASCKYQDHGIIANCRPLTATSAPTYT